MIGAKRTRPWRLGTTRPIPRSVCPTVLPLPGEVITKELRTECKGRTERGGAGPQCVRSDHRWTGFDFLGARAYSQPTNTTHVDFGFAHYRYAIFVLHWFTSCEWDAEVREDRALWRREEIVGDESDGLDGCVCCKVVAHR